jgi:hypothetical protein
MIEMLKDRINLLETLIKYVDDFLNHFRTVEMQYGFRDMPSVFSSDEITKSIQLLLDDDFGIFTTVKEILNYTYKPKSWITEVDLIKFCSDFYQYLIDMEMAKDDLDIAFEILNDISMRENLNFLYVKEILTEIKDNHTDDLDSLSN